MLESLKKQGFDLNYGAENVLSKFIKINIR
jgi:hypothetical protein